MSSQNISDFRNRFDDTYTAIAHQLLAAGKNLDANADAVTAYTVLSKKDPEHIIKNYVTDGFAALGQHRTFQNQIYDYRALRGGDISYLNLTSSVVQDEATNPLNLTYGCYVVVARTRAGKSTFIRALGVPTVSVLEPVADAWTDHFAASCELFDLLTKHSDVAVDSFKSLITVGDNAGEFGVTAAFSELLTRLAIFAVTAKRRIFIVVNPYMVPDQALTRFINRMEGVSTGVIFRNETAAYSGGRVWSVVSRDSGRDVRNFAVTADGRIITDYATSIIDDNASQHDSDHKTVDVISDDLDFDVTVGTPTIQLQSGVK